jgi:hypothetical protein
LRTGNSSFAYLKLENTFKSCSYLRYHWIQFSILNRKKHIVKERNLGKAGYGMPSEESSLEDHMIVKALGFMYSERKSLTCYRLEI